jgi:ubiquinone/menaquinone biosynthesis C-methylase UbiE
MTEEVYIQDQRAAAAFDAQSASFDLIYGNDSIIRYKRERVRAHLEKWLQPEASILELNAGTGEDAIYLGGKGYRVHATDISPGMLDILNARLWRAGLEARVTTELCSFSYLSQLSEKGPFDHIFSNFAGLNCSSELDKVLQSFDTLLRPGGRVTLVILPRFCLWEFLLLFKGKFQTAFRRFAGRRGAAAKINDKKFRCWYYNPSFVKRSLGPGYKMLSLEGLCSIVPPSYLEGFAEKRPGLFLKLKRWEERMRFSWPWRVVGDYYIISLEKRSL